MEKDILMMRRMANKGIFESKSESRERGQPRRQSNFKIFFGFLL